MRIETITLEDIKKYSNLDPFGTLKRLVFPNYFAICAFDRESGGNETPAGIAVACEEKDGVSIDWLFVRSGFRKKGIGEALIKRLFDLAIELEKNGVYFKVKKEAGLSRMTESVKKYLTNRSFTETKKKYMEYCIDVKSFTDNPVIAVDKKKILKAKPLGILKPAEILKAVKSLMGEKTAMALYDMDEYVPVFDAKLSSVLMFEDEACGLLLMKSTGSDCYPIFLYSESPQETSALMVCSGLLASLYLSDRTNIRFMFPDKDLQSYMKKVFPDYSYGVEIMFSDMKDYIGDEDDDEDDFIFEDDDEDDDDFDFDFDDDDLDDDEDDNDNEDEDDIDDPDEDPEDEDGYSDEEDYSDEDFEESAEFEDEDVDEEDEG